MLYQQAGLVHYVINMLALRFVGAAVEMSHGWFAAFVIFTLSAVGGTVLSAIFLPDAISVGASGGIFGAYEIGLGPWTMRATKLRNSPHHCIFLRFHWSMSC